MILHTVIKDEATGIMQGVTINQSDAGISIEPSGCQMEDGVTEIINLEHYEGQWRLIVFAKPDQEHPTHTIVIPKTIDPDKQWEEKHAR
jgi:hypothetical protein